MSTDLKAWVGELIVSTEDINSTEHPDIVSTCAWFDTRLACSGQSFTDAAEAMTHPPTVSRQAFIRVDAHEPARRARSTIVEESLENPPPLKISRLSSMAQLPESGRGRGVCTTQESRFCGEP